MLTTTSKTFEFTDPDAPGWVALVEVKGYTKGAKTEAPTQFLRFRSVTSSALVCRGR